MTDITTTPRTFTITGRYRGRQVAITWTEGVGFGDPPPMPIVETTAQGDQVCATATGPCWDPGDTPPEAAWMTAIASLDEVTDIHDPDHIHDLILAAAELEPGEIS
jgi:hypothetical protein